MDRRHDESFIAIDSLWVEITLAGLARGQFVVILGSTVASVFVWMSHVLWRFPVAGAAAVSGAEDVVEEGLEAWEVSGDDADVALDDGPDGDVARIPQPVSSLAIIGQVANLDQACGGCARKVSHAAIEAKQ